MILLGESAPNLLLLVLCMILISLYCFFMYFKSKVSMITIQYAGGEIGFDKKWFTTQEIDLFQKQLRMAKDKAIEESELNISRNMEQAISKLSAQPAETPSINKLDELTKLGNLLEKGIITQEEFENMKKDLM